MCKKRKNSITVSTEQEPGDSWRSSLTFSFSSSRELYKASSKHHRTNQSMKIKPVVNIKNQSFNEETALTACNNLLPLPSSPLHVTQGDTSSISLLFCSTQTSDHGFPCYIFLCFVGICLSLRVKI